MLKMFRQYGKVLAAGLLIAAPGASAESLAQTLVNAYNHSGLLEQNRALLRAADEDVAQAVAGLRPIIGWSADITRRFGQTRNAGFTRNIWTSDATAGLTASLLLFDYRRTKLTIEATKETVLATRQNLVSIEQQVLLRGVQAYMNVIRNSEFVALRESNLRLLRQELRAANDRFDVGEVTRTDVAQAEARVASAKSGLAFAQGNLMQAVAEFTAATGRKPGHLKTPSSLPKLKNSVEAANAVALRLHPDLRSVQHQVSAAELFIAVAEAAMKPTTNLTGSFGVTESTGTSDFTHSGSIGVEMSGAIYQGGRLSSAKRQAMAQRDAQRGNLHVVRHLILQNVGNAYANLGAARAARVASVEEVRAARVAFRGVREEAKLGARTTLDVLDAEQELLNAQANLISADADLHIAAYAVLASMGRLTAKDLNLGIQTYDPAAYYDLVKTAPVRASKQGKQLDRVLRALGKE